MYDVNMGYVTGRDLNFRGVISLIRDNDFIRLEFASGMVRFIARERVTGYIVKPSTEHVQGWI